MEFRKKLIYDESSLWNLLSKEVCDVQFLTWFVWMKKGNMLERNPCPCICVISCW